MKQQSCPSKRFLWIGAFSNNAHDYVHETVHHLHFPYKEALNFLNEQAWEIDAFIITTVHTASELLIVKGIAAKKNIPVILYSPSCEPLARELALNLKLDEYCYGTLSGTLTKRVEVLKRLREYKAQVRALRRKSLNFFKSKVYQLVAKRTFDVLISSMVLLVLSPAFLIILLTVRIVSAGPILEISKRVGFGYKTFDYYKFYTLFDEISSENNSTIYRIGYFLQRSGLSELPAFLNVLKGDLSMVGTKPLLPEDAEKLTQDQIALRFMTPAGITGLWRIDNGSPDKPDLDMEYARYRSFWIDFKILFSTFLLPLRKKNANALA